MLAGLGNLLPPSQLDFGLTQLGDDFFRLGLFEGAGSL
jgi:hypothetical protein